MTQKELDRNNHVARNCGYTTLLNDRPTGVAFLPKADHEFLSVNWLEFFGEVGQADQIEGVRQALANKGRSIGKKSIFAVLNIGRLLDDIREESEDGRDLRVYLENDIPEDPSHSGIHGYNHEDNLIADLIAFCIEETVYPAKQ